MKKLFIILSLAGVVALTSCKNENTVNPASPMSKATITGIVRAEINANQNGLELVPAGTKVIVTVNTKDLVLSSDDAASYGTKYYQTTTDASGSYTINVDLNSNQTPLTVKITASDFIADKITGPNPTDVDVKHLYTCPTTSQSVYPSNTFYHDINYN